MRHPPNEVEEQIARGDRATEAAVRRTEIREAQNTRKVEASKIEAAEKVPAIPSSRRIGPRNFLEHERESS